MQSNFHMPFFSFQKVKNRLVFFILKKIALLISLFLLSFNGFAVKTWIATGTDSSWYTAANWSPSGVPANTDDVTIAATNGATPTVPCICNSSSTAAYCKNLTINLSASLYVWNSGGSPSYLYIYNSLTVNGTMSAFRRPGSSSLSLYFNPILIGNGSTSGAPNTISVGASGDASKAEIQIGNSLAAYYNLASNAKFHGFLLNIGDFKLNSYNLTVWQFLSSASYSNTGKVYVGSGTLKLCGTSQDPVILSISSGYWDNSGGGTVEYNATGTEWTGSHTSQYTGTILSYVGNQTVYPVSYNKLNVKTINPYKVSLGDATNTPLTISGDLEITNPNTAGGTAESNVGTQNISIGGNIYLGATATTNPSGNAFTLNCKHRIYRGVGTGTITMGNNSAHAINITYLDANGAGNEMFTGFGTPSFYGTVDYGSVGSQEIIGANFYTLAVNKSITGTGTKELLGDITVSNELKIWFGTLSATDGTTARNIALQGNFYNLGAFTPSTGKVTCSGGSAQIFGGVFTSFYDLDINKSANNVDIVNTSGILVTHSVGFLQGDFNNLVGTPLTFETDATISDAADNGSHVNGYVAKKTNTISEFIFPCGNGTKYRYCTVKPSSTTTRTYLVKYTKSAYSTLTVANPADLDHVSSFEYWDIAATAFATIKDARVKLSWDASSGVSSVATDTADLVIAHYNGASWDLVTGGTGAYIHTVNASTGELAWAGDFTTFSPFTLASKSKKHVLPIELFSFTANCTNDNVFLQWSTATELSNDYFTIERSANAIDWETTGVIDGAGHSITSLTYTFIDESPLAGTSYYRLKQTDFDGKNKTFDIVSVSCTDENLLTLNLNPNPANKELSIEIKGKNDELKSVFIKDAFGQEVMTIKIPGNGETKINIEHLSKGVYFVSSSSTEIKPVKFIKQ